MEVWLHDSVEDFRKVAVDIYRHDPLAATVELTALRADLPDPDQAPLLVTVWNGGAPVGAAMQTPPFPLLCTGLPEATIDDVVTEILRVRRDLNGVRGPRRIATRFARGVAGSHRGAHHREHRGAALRLDKLCPPTAVAGEPRSADDADTGVLVDWLTRFHAEQFGDAPDPAAARSVHAAKQLGDEFVLWTLESDLASMAAVRSPAAGVSRIGPVHTPPTGADTATARR